ncbi:flagellin [Hydrogenispora ethanolica]|jgi:flagellin|nr:flagellin [Hydrogenispora ethanolica]
MIINHNLSALNTYNQLNLNNTAMNKSLQKLSSGYRINAASDDAAGLAISEKMRGQIRGLDQASENAQDAISMVQTAEGALDETTNILQRMRELAVQSSSDTNTDSDRQNIQDEMDALIEEINRIANDTEFNTKKLLDGSMGSKTGDVANVLSNTALDTATAATSTLTTLNDSDTNSLGISASDTVTVSYVKNGELISYDVTVATDTTLADLADADANGTNTDDDFTLTVTADGVITATANTAGTADAVYGLTITVKDADGDTNTTATNALSSFTQTTKAQDKRNDGSSTVLIGANTGQSINISIDKMDAASLGVEGLDVSSQDAADIAIKVIDTATSVVTTARSKMGAIQNRLDSTINNLTTSSENLTSAESRIRDVDMASEMANYTKLSVLNQAATTMLAQANQLPQRVLTLLQG